MESLSKSFENAHGNRLKSAFAETLLHLMYSIAKVGGHSRLTLTVANVAV